MQVGEHLWFGEWIDSGMLDKCLDDIDHQLAEIVKNELDRFQVIKICNQFSQKLNEQTSGLKTRKLHVQSPASRAPLRPIISSIASPCMADHVSARCLR